MGFSKTAANSILSSYIKNKYVGLFTAAPSDDGTTVTYSEVSASDYSRAALSGAMGDPSLGVIQNSNIVYFPECTSSGGWGTVTHFGIFDVATPSSGQPKVYGALDSSVQITVNHVPLFRAGELKFTLA